MAEECMSAQANFGDASVVCNQECTAAIDACGPLPYLPTVQSCKSWCEGVSVSSEGLDESIDLAGALIVAGCPTGTERLRVLFSELIEVVEVCEDACDTEAAEACYAGGANEDFDEAGCQVSCSTEYFAQETGFIEDGSCTELIEGCNGSPCQCVETCTSDSASSAMCNSSCVNRVAAGLYVSLDTCVTECFQGGSDALIIAACWTTAPTASLAVARCEQGYGTDEIAQECIDLCVPTPGEPSDICSEWTDYSCALVCEGARRWAHPDATDEIVSCVSGMLGTSCDVFSIGAQCGNLACTPSGCPANQEVCKTGLCDLNQGACVLVNKVPGVSCDEGDQCVSDGVCDAGQCVGDVVVCDIDNNAGSGCEEAFCDSSQGCITVPLDSGTSCDDGDLCSVSDTCDGSGQCSGDPVSCDDNVDCTSDTCEVGVGCVFTPHDAECSDGVDCTVDTCEENGCHHVPDVLLCDDGVECTSPACDLVNDCQFIPKDDQCDDGDDCTSDLCSPSQGCLFDPIDNCVGLPGGGGGEIGLDILCKDGTEPDSYEVIVLSNPGAESGKQDWNAEFGLFEAYSDQGLANCQVPTPPQGDHAWILGEMCDNPGGTVPFYSALTTVELTSESKAIMQSGHGQVRLTAQAGTYHSGVEIEAMVRWGDGPGQETSVLGETDVFGPAPQDWNIIRAVVPIEPDLNSIHVGVKIGGDVSPFGGWFDDVHVEMLKCP
jgi:hypothetical protein